MRMPAQFLEAAPRRPTSRRATNVTINPELVTEAKELGINLSQAFEHGLRLALSEARAARWLEENHEAVESSNAYVEANGLPLAHLRLF